MHVLFQRTLSAFASFALAGAAAAPAFAQSAAAIDGAVVDAQSGLPLSNADVAVSGANGAVRTNARGAFRLDGLAPGIYRLRLAHPGYQSAESDDVVLAASETVHLTLSLNATAEPGGTTVIGRTGTRAADVLQRSSTISRTLTGGTLIANGTFRAGDALRQLPGVFTGVTGDTGALGDDIPLNIRGLGALETLTTLDGHPVAYGASGGFNFQASPLVGMREVSVLYGTGGGDTLGVNAIGGVIDFRTLEPTNDLHATFSQGLGTFNRVSSIGQTTGSIGRLGFAAAGGLSSLDGPLINSPFASVTTMWDPSSPDPALRQAATYTYDSNASAQTGMLKLRWSFSPSTTLTFTGFSTNYYENKTGNGDQDYQTYDYAFAIGSNLLKAKATKDPCPSGQFQATNSYGVAYGTGPNGRPDGGAPNGCVTVAQYAQFNTGPAGAGAAAQTVQLNDGHVNFTTGWATNILQIDAFTNHYTVVFDRRNRLPDFVGTLVNGKATFPYVEVPGQGPGAVTRDSDYATSGATMSYTLAGARNQLTFGFQYLNAADRLFSQGLAAPTLGAAVVSENGPFIRDVYRFEGIPLTLFANAYVRHSTATNTSSFNPRVSLVATPTRNDVVRASFGAATSQPSAQFLNQPFVASPPGGAGGGGTINCNLVSIGSAPSTILQPERGIDEELSVAHRFADDTRLQVTFYNENIFNKIFSGVGFPINLAAPPFAIDPNYLASAISTITSRCGANYTAALTGSANLGQLRSQGIMLDGRVRFNRRAYVDFDYGVTSTVLASGITQLLQRNPTFVVGSQLPRVPLQQLNTALDGFILPQLEGRFGYHWVSTNNTKALPAYNWSDASLSYPVGTGTLTFTLNNVFNQYASLWSTFNTGVPLGLNQYATNVAPLTGSGATEGLSIAPRMLYVNYSLRLR